MISDETREKWEHKIETIFEATSEGCIELNQWEADFFNSVYDRVINHKIDLSWKQTKVLNRIYELII